mmetsp:Transcript_24382/g.26656  ORF Transcript_24382/g.26656 Transcript_24382/m.26656 type:complete len:98 (+) Transcript_24382:91-384(+)
MFRVILRGNSKLIGMIAREPQAILGRPLQMSFSSVEVFEKKERAEEDRYIREMEKQLKDKNSKPPKKPKTKEEPKDSNKKTETPTQEKAEKGGKKTK